MSKEAMKLALEALENAEYGDHDKKELNKAIIALREELAREKSTAWVTAGPHTVPLVTQPAQQEPFGYFRYDLRLDAWVQNRAGTQGTPFYTSPPAQRTWVGLTDEEVKHMLELFVVPPHHVDMVVQAIEAKLKEKNI